MLIADHKYLIGMDGEEQSQSSNGFLSTTQVGHGLEPLAGRHAVVVDTLEVGLFRVLWAEEGLGRLVLRQRLVNLVDRVRHVVETPHK